MDTEESAELATPEVANELKAALAARRELDPDMEEHVLEAFLTRLEHRIDRRVQQDMSAANVKVPRHGMKGEGVNVGVIGASFALSIPLMFIAGFIAHTAGVLAVVVGLVLVNLLYFIDRWVRMG